ncbi:MAG: glycosyltransferase family 39 protein [Anaerolineae bacterium]|nr:glycosyltransferase family 39 protein [Anaerolineae bacterium]
MVARSQSKSVEFPRLSVAALWQDEAIRHSVIIFLVLRIATGVVAAFLFANEPVVGRPPLLWFDPVTRVGNANGETYESSLPLNAPLAYVVMPWRTYDTTWYARIAMMGYRSWDNSIVFPPLYPALMALLAPFLGGNYILASLIISNVFCLITFILLYKLVQREFGDNKLAMYTLIALAAFPTAFFLVSGYTETLFMALTLGAFFAAFDRKWWLAGILGFLASLTRLQGAALALPLAWIAYIEYRDHNWKLPALLARAPAALGAGLGTLSYIAYITLSGFGSLERAYNTGWKLTSRPPWQAFYTFFQRLQQGIVPEHEYTNFVITVLFIGLAVLVTYKMKSVYSIYVWSTLFVLLVRYHYGTLLEGAQFESMIRYVLMLFPCFIMIGMAIRRWWYLAPYLVIGLQWHLALLYRFIHWIWVA